MAKATHPRGDDGDDPAGAGSHPTDRDARTAPPALEVAVARTGGFAGTTRRWSAQPPEDVASEWISLIDRCPWDHARPVGDAEPVSHSAAMPDRFVWWIRVSIDSQPREAEVPDAELTGAWRELVEAVREWDRAAGQSARDAR